MSYDAVLAVVLVAVTSYVAFDTSDRLLKGGAVVMYGLAGIAAARAVWRFRYRQVVKSVYAVEHSGIRVQHLPSEPFIAWDQIVKAEYVPVIPAYRLLASGQTKPIVLFVERSWDLSGVTNRRNQLAAQYIRVGMGPRLSTRWVPW